MSDFVFNLLSCAANVPVTVTLISAYFSDRYNARALPAALLSCLAVAGFATYLSMCTVSIQLVHSNLTCLSEAEHKYVSYGALFLAVPGVYATIPVVAAWMANNSEPYYRRATSIALGFIATNSVRWLIRI